MAYDAYRSAIRIEEGKDRQPSFYNLIQLWKQQPKAINEPGIAALQDAVDRWRQLYGRYHCMDLADRLFEAAPGDLSIGQGGEGLNEGE